MKIALRFTSLLVFIFIVFACNIPISPAPTTTPTTTEPTIPKAATPEASIHSGKYIGTISVELTSSNQSAKIYYTLDGTNPTEANGNLYNSPIIIDFDCILKAIAYIDNHSPSDVLIENYSFPPITFGRAYNFIDGKWILSPYYALGNEVHILPMEKKYPGDSTTPFASTVYAKIIDNDVYVYGSYFDGYETIPCYWVNDTLIKLPIYTDSDWGACYDVYKKHGIIYAVGYSADSGYVRCYPCLWVDENLTILSTGDQHVDAKKILFNGDDQYILCSGYHDATGTTSVNYFFKNGIRYDISSTDSKEFIYDISVIDNQIILLGIKYESQSPSMMYEKPFFIINNQKHYFDLNGNLTIKDINSKFLQIYNISNNFYFISNVIPSFYPDGTPAAIIPYIWKDGEYIPNGIDPTLKISYSGSKNNKLYIIDIINKRYAYSSNADFSLPDWKPLSLPSSEYLQYREGIIF
jgi:hypothetical protein